MPDMHVRAAHVSADHGQDEAPGHGGQHLVLSGLKSVGFGKDRGRPQLAVGGGVGYESS